jgi:cyclohexanecarboxylate-CoA ligase
MMADLMPALPSLRKVVVVGHAKLPHQISFDELLAASRFEGAGRTDPDAVTEIVFTSGTTGEPKGVMHSSNSNMCPLFNLIDEHLLTSQDSILMASTFGHQTGFVYGGQLPAVLGGTLVLLDQWDPREAIALIEKERVTWTMSATPFLQDLVEHGTRKALASLRNFLCSGAPIPSSLLAAARQMTDAAITSGWGMTEVGLVTLSKRADADERIANSDGRAFDDMAIRIVDEQGEPARAGEEGDLMCSGPSMFLGYYKRPGFVAAAFEDGRWLRTGDRGRVDEQGYLRIVGRSKDIIIRGGENIPIIEVENLLCQHPAVERVAIIAVPDPRMQERACAVVVLRPSQALSFEGMHAHLLQFKLARQYIPEYLVVLDSLPMTPSGKVQKYVLRAQIETFLGQAREDRHAQAV